MIPITILTGFLGSGKTTLLQKIIENNPDKKFGLIINEYGQVGIDGQLVEGSGEEIVELSNGCMCCIVRSDLYTATQKLIHETKVNYIIIEASGLAESKPIADTFVMNNLNNQVSLDSIVCVVDIDNFEHKNTDKKIALNQLKFSDIIILNKVEEHTKEEVSKIRATLQAANPEASILVNQKGDLKTSLLIDSGKWTIEKILEQKTIEDQKADNHHDHNHNHNNYEEVVFISKPNQTLDPVKLDNWLQFKFPDGCVRSKGVLNLEISKSGANPQSGAYLFQMVGASKMLTPFDNSKKIEQSKLVLIGQGLNEIQILRDLQDCVYIK